MNKKLLIQNLSAIFTGHGLVNKDGRRPNIEDCGFIKGPLNIEIDVDSGKLLRILSPSQSPQIDSSYQVFNGDGLIASPAFIDSHTHSLFAGTRATEYFMRWSGESYVGIAKKGGGIRNTFLAVEAASEESLLQDLYTKLSKMRQGGALCVEIKSGYAATPEGELRLLRLINKAKADPRCPVRIRSTFLPLHALPKGAIEDDYVSSMIALLPTIVKESLADHVDAFPEDGFFSLQQSLRFAREALNLGLRSKIHADELTPMGCVENFVPLNALSVDHLQKISRSGIDSLLVSSTVATFLPATSFYVDLDYAPARKVIDAGARFALATDYNPGTAPESQLQLTCLLAASKMKLSATEIFSALTFGAAASLGLEKEQGHLSPGTRADILLWKTQTPPQDSEKGQEILEEIFVESLKPHFTLLGGRGSFSQQLRN
jgi:imidazolonepropionase